MTALAAPAAVAPVAGTPVGGAGFAASTFVLVAITFSRASESIEASTGLPPISSALAIALLLAVLVTGAERRGPRPMAAVVVVVTAGAAAVAAFSAVGARDPGLSIEALDGLLRAAVIAVAVVVLVSTPRRLDLALSGMVVATLVVAAVNLLQAVTGSYGSTYLGLARPAYAALDRESGWRLGGPLGDPNFFAQVLVVGVVVSLARLVAARRSGRTAWLALAAAVIGTATLLLTYSRGGLLAFVVATMLLAVRWLRWRAVVGAVVVAILLTVLAPDALLGRVSTAVATVPKAMAGETVDDTAINGRASEAMVGYEEFSDHWLLGVGAGNYPVHYRDYAQGLGLDTRGVERDAHSLVVETIAETGVVGLAVLAVTLLLAFAAVASLRRSFPGGPTDPRWWSAVTVEAGLVAHLTCALFLHGAYPRGLWLLLGLALACGQIRSVDRRPDDLVAA